MAQNGPQVVAVALQWPTTCCYGLAYPLARPQYWRVFPDFVTKR